MKGLAGSSERPTRALNAQRGATAGKFRRSLTLNWLFIAPAAAVFIAVVIVPSLQSLWYSFFSWNGFSEATWVGLANYADFVTDPLIGEALSHTGVLILFFSIIPIFLGLVSAGLLSRMQTGSMGFFRSVIFLPQVLTSVVIVVVWKQIYAVDGPLNSTLVAVGLENLTQPWLGSFEFALPALGLVGMWTGMGFCMLLFLAGVGNIPTELYDAARVDGAGAIREFFTVTLPGVVPQLAVALTLTIIGAFRAFDLIWLTTRGGPGTSTVTPALLLYSKTFVEQDVGGGAAIGVVLAIVSGAIALTVIRATEGRK